MLYKSSIRENVESQKTLEKLANIILEECAMRSVPLIKKIVKEKGEFYSIYGDTFNISNFKSWINPIFFPVGTHHMEYTKKQITKELKPLIANKDMWIRIEFLQKGEKSTTLGQYSSYHKEITVYISKSDYEEAEGHIIEAYVTEGFPIYLSKLLIILNKYKKTLIHELQHYYDDVRSGGKYATGSNYSNDPESDEYWKSPVEVSARYTDTIKQLKDNGILPQAQWKSVLSQFKILFRKWEILDATTQERLIKRLAQEYNEGQKQKTEPTLDISKQVEKLQSLYDEKQVELKYDKRNGMIEIYRLKTASIQEDEQVLKQVIKLADTYRHLIGTYIEKGFVTSMGQTSSLLKKYGFKSNHGNKTNYKFSTSKSYFIRQPKRK